MTLPSPSSDTASLDTAHTSVLELVERFERNLSHYLSPAYQEAELRQDFLDRFLAALGWDVYHTTQTNPAEQEVKIERGVAVAMVCIWTLAEFS